MKLEKWALVAEIVGAAAIVISLVYLIIEVRENTDAVNASNRQSTAARAQELALASATDPFLRRIQTDSNVELTDLAPEDAVGLNAFIAAHLRNAEEAYWQYRDGRLDESYMLTRRAVALLVLNSPAARDLYATGLKANGTLTPEFQAWLDDALRERYDQ
jgi:hypothetical protein